jgi:hypothetical protein
MIGGQGRARHTIADSVQFCGVLSCVDRGCGTRQRVRQRATDAPCFPSMHCIPTLAVRAAKSIRAQPDSSLYERVSSRNVYEATDAKTPSRERIIAACVGGE